MGYVQFLLHLFGDYIVQNDWMAMTKKKPGWNGFLACLVHTVLYALPFFLITNWAAVLVIWITHFILDRWKIVDYFLMWKNGVSDIKNFGFHHDRPPFISVWINIFVDNSFHLIINYLAITYIVL